MRRPSSRRWPSFARHRRRRGSRRSATASRSWCWWSATPARPRPPKRGFGRSRRSARRSATSSSDGRTLSLQTLLDATQPKGRRYYWKSEYVPTATPDLLDFVAEQAPTFTSPHSSLIVFPIDGAHPRRSNDHSAVGNRDAGAVLNIGASWEPAEDDEANIGWARSLWQDARRFSTGGVYVNFLTERRGRGPDPRVLRCQPRAARAHQGGVGPG